jgi:hypothetical protein
MALWAKTDAEASVPKYLTDEQRKKAIFIDSTEALDVDTKAKNITCPGWWLYDSYKDSSGKIRHKVELLVPMNAVTAVAAGDRNLDAGIDTADTYVLDFSLQPANASVTAPAAATFTATGTISSGGGAISYQWQEASALDRNFADLTDAGIYSGTTTNTLSLSSTAGFAATINSAGSAAGDDRTINLAGAIVTKGEKYSVTIGSDVFTYTAAANSTAASIATALAGLIDVHVSYTAVVNGSVNTQIDITDGAGLAIITFRTTALNKRKYRVVISATNAVSEVSKFGTLSVI